MCILKTWLIMVTAGIGLHSWVKTKSGDSCRLPHTKLPVILKWSNWKPGKGKEEGARKESPPSWHFPPLVLSSATKAADSDSPKTISYHSTCVLTDRRHNLYSSPPDVTTQCLVLPTEGITFFEPTRFHLAPIICQSSGVSQ